MDSASKVVQRPYAGTASANVAALDDELNYQKILLSVIGRVLGRCNALTLVLTYLTTHEQERGCAEMINELKIRPYIFEHSIPTIELAVLICGFETSPGVTMRMLKYDAAAKKATISVFFRAPPSSS
jgi:hypothetical protein